MAINDEALDDRIILPDHSVKLTLTNPLLQDYVLNSGKTTVFVDNNPYKKRYLLTRADFEECIDLLQQSLIVDHWMHDCWDGVGRPSSLVNNQVTKSIQYAQDLLEAYEYKERFLISTILSQ